MREKLSIISNATNTGFLVGGKNVSAMLLEEMTNVKLIYQDVFLHYYTGRKKL